MSRLRLARTAARRTCAVSLIRDCCAIATDSHFDSNGDDVRMVVTDAAVGVCVFEGSRRNQARSVTTGQWRDEARSASPLSPTLLFRQSVVRTLVTLFVLVAGLASSPEGIFAQTAPRAGDEPMLRVGDAVRITVW